MRSFAILKVVPLDSYQTVYKLVKKIPASRVATYRQVASLLGKSRSVQLVGWVLANCSSDIPWQRVVNRNGMISIENLRLSKVLQVDLLKQKGIEVKFERHNWWVNLKKYLWQS